MNRWRTSAGVLAVLLAVLVAFGVRALYEGRSSLAMARAMEQQGDLERAIALGARAARWHVPMASHAVEAFDLLRAFALRAEATGDRDRALLAWQSIRGAARSQQSLWSSFAVRLAEADQHIAGLLSAQPSLPFERDKSAGRRFEELREALAQDQRPKTWAVLLALVGFAGWCLAVARLQRGLFPARPRVGHRVAHRWELRDQLPWVAAALVGLSAFLIALARA